ncbi:ribonuclease HI [Roseobacter sp. AzwK-3b]|uniref:ribonuclease HI n=1 Tax=Roseobacter sp. AzwK-3b TaxID=351016 RepID=UPI00336A64C5
MRLGRSHQERVDAMVAVRRSKPVRGPGVKKAAASSASRDNFDVVIYTDGACAGNPGPGGWGAILIDQRHGGASKHSEIAGYDIDTTGNRMEMMAAIQALEVLGRGVNVLIWSDNQYVIRSITRWIKKWKANGWKVKGGAMVKNIDLWQRLDEAQAQHNVRWRWVKSHSGNVGNEMADKLACKMRDEAIRKMKSARAKAV